MLQYFHHISCKEACSSRETEIETYLPPLPTNKNFLMLQNLSCSRHSPVTASALGSCSHDQDLMMDIKWNEQWTTVNVAVRSKLLSCPTITMGTQRSQTLWPSWLNTTTCCWEKHVKVMWIRISTHKWIKDFSIFFLKYQFSQTSYVSSQWWLKAKDLQYILSHI